MAFLKIGIQTNSGCRAGWKETKLSKNRFSFSSAFTLSKYLTPALAATLAPTSSFTPYILEGLQIVFILWNFPVILWHKYLSKVILSKNIQKQNIKS
jgi:hypothetical protein